MVTTESKLKYTNKTNELSQKIKPQKNDTDLISMIIKVRM